MRDGSAGLVVVPTRLLKFRSKRTVAAPAARICAGTSVPDATAIVTPGFAGMGAPWPPKSAQRGAEGTPQPSAWTTLVPPANAAAPAAATRRRRFNKHAQGSGERVRE